MDQTVSKASGRICLLGDNADLIEKPAIAAAISAFLEIALKKRNDDRIILWGKDINFQEEFRLNDTLTLDSPLRYLKAVYNRLQKYITTGFEASVHSEIPISAGVSSSAALLIAFIRALSRAYGISLDNGETAELAFVVESEDLQVECGRMDQYAIAFGGVTYIETGSNPKVEKLPARSLPIIVADTQEKHDTKELQIWLRDKLKNDAETMESLLRVVDLVELGKDAILKGNLQHLGELMIRQQVEEKFMGTSTDRLELFCKTALEAGAWGAKQMGAGGGGCIVALCSAGDEAEIASALRALEAPVWAFKIVD
ncbi:MAG: hypothetical protein AB1798_10200 [Spirochaetota bacterium]